MILSWQLADFSRYPHPNWPVFPFNNSEKNLTISISFWTTFYFHSTLSFALQIFCQLTWWESRVGTCQCGTSFVGDVYRHARNATWSWFACRCWLQVSLLQFGNSTILKDNRNERSHIPRMLSISLKELLTDGCVSPIQEELSILGFCLFFNTGLSSRYTIVKTMPLTLHGHQFWATVELPSLFALLLVLLKLSKNSNARYFGIIILFLWIHSKRCNQ